MFLKLRVRFFEDFDKKTLRLVMERMLCQVFRRNTIVARNGEQAENISIVINGRLTGYEDVPAEDVERCKNDRKKLGDVDENIYEAMDSFGDDAMADDCEWEETIIADKKSLVLSIHKKDMIEVLSHVKVLNQSNKQTFLLKS